MDTSDLPRYYLSDYQAFVKRSFDLLLAFIGLFFTWPFIIVIWAIASFDTRSNGFFFQKRVGRNGQLFWLVKIKTMRRSNDITTSITRSNDPRITPLGCFLRNYKLDELPQLWNVFWGDMSFVGPRPDVPGFADCLEGGARAVLSIRPGITGPATLKYRNEEVLLAARQNPEAFNRDVIWPDKVRINLDYIKNWSLRRDIQYILRSVEIL